MLKEAIPKLDFSECNCFCGLSQNETIGCPICLTDMSLLKSRNASKFISVTGKKYHRIEQSVLEKLGAETDNYNIFVTPCGHCFHETCLTSWLAENQNCPVDRSELPAISK